MTCTISLVRTSSTVPGEDGSPVYRCLAELDDVYGAEERIMEALRYSAGVMARWWGPLAGA